MEENNVESSYCATGPAPNASCQDGDGYQSQKKMLPETRVPVNDQISSTDPLSSPQKETSSEETLFKRLLRKSPKLRTPVKTQQLSPFKSTKRLFISPAKRKETKTCTPKRHKPNEISSVEVDDKRKTSPYDKNKNGQLNLQDENVAKEKDVISGPIQNKATKGKLPVKKVKPVNHDLQQVMEMFKDVLESDQQDTTGQSSTQKIDVAASRFEYLPTMTRQRVREFLQKISMPSPIKTAREGPSIMDVEFNEEDDDDEYNPEKDEESHESDDESITSSKLSEFGSPYRDFSSTSFMTPSRDRVVAQSTVTTEVTSDTVAEADLPTMSNKSFENVLTIDTEYTGEELDDGIALRTRSKQPLTSTSITEIESAFVAPDITTDMYDNYCVDAEYAQFLSSLFKTADDPMTDDDTDANDPEFNFEAETEHPDKEESRFDKPTQIPKKELAILIGELNELFDNEMLPHQVVASASEMTGSWKVQPGGQNMPSSSQEDDPRGSQPSKFKTPHQPLEPPPPPPPGPTSQPPPPSSPHLAHITSSYSKPSQPGTQSNSFTDFQKNSASSTDTDRFVTPEQRALIADNIRKHIQLLLQSYLLCQNSSSLIQQATESKSMITELDYFRQSSGVSGASAFSVCNLDPALELLSTSAFPENNTENNIRETVWTLSRPQKLTILNSPAFSYPHLLPHLIKPKTNERKYNNFFQSEDNLIALGLEQFKMFKVEKSFELVHQLLIRGKTVDQIVHRVQYMASVRSLNNPIKAVKKTGTLPELLPKTAVDSFYTVAPKDQMSDRLPAWCSTPLSLLKVQSGANTNLSQPSSIGQLSQQKLSGWSAKRARISHRRMNPMQQTPSQLQSSFRISPMTQPVTIPAIQLANGVLSVELHFKLSEGTGAGTLVPPAISIEPRISTVLESRPMSTQSHNQQSTKRKLSELPSTIGFKKQRIEAPSVDEVDVDNTSAEVLQSASPDLLAKTIASSGIQEFLVYPSPESQFQYSHDPDHQGMSFASSTPIAQDKHPSVRNLAWEFDIAHKQSLHSIPVTETQITEKIDCAQSKSPCSEVSVCQTMVTRNETAETLQPRACLQSSLHHTDPDVNGKPQKEETRISKDSQENLILYSNAPLVSNHDLLCDIPKHTTASTGNDFAGSTDETSQSINSSNSPPTSDTVNMETKKQAPNIVDENNTQEIELSIEDQKFSDFSSKSHLRMNITFQSQTENMATVDSGLASDCTNQNDNRTCETVQGDQIAQSVCHLSVQNDNGTCEALQGDQTVCNLSVQNDNRTCETVQGDQTAQSVCNLSVHIDNGTCETVQGDQTAQSVCYLSVQNDNRTCETVQGDQTAQSVCNLSVHIDNGTCEALQGDQTVCNLSVHNDNRTCETVQGDQTAQSVCNLSVQNVNRTCETVQGDQTAQPVCNLSVHIDNGTCEALQGDQTVCNLSVQNDKDSLHIVTETYEIVQDDRPVQSDINLSVNDDKETLSNLTESNSTLTEDVFLPVLTDESSSSPDKTLTGASENISDRINSNESDNGEGQAKGKPKTIKAKETTNMTQPTKCITLTNKNSEASTTAQQKNGEGLAKGKSKTIRQILKAAEKSKTTTNTSVLTPEGDYVTSDMGSQNTDNIIKANETTNMTQPTQGTTLTNKNSEASTVAQQKNKSPSFQCFSITTPTPAATLISLQSPVKSSHSNNSSKFPSPFKTPTKLHPLLPKSPSAGSSSSHYVPLPKSSPKRKELNKHVRQILPKSFIFEIKSPSPTKTAAQILKKKATLFCQNRSPVKLLPKQPQTALIGPPRSNPLLGPSRMFTRSQKIKVKSTGKKSCQKTAAPVVKDPPPNKEKVIVEPAVMETDDAVLSQEEEEEGFESDDQSQLDDLMAACTTIGYDPKKGISGTDNDNKSKAQKKKDVCLSMLEPDIIDGDAKKDERDTAYAQHYFTHIKQVLGDDAERFKKFLTILHDMNRNHMSPVELYADMATLLSGHQDLVDDFAGFLLSFQAVECNCFVSYMEYQQILTFLRRLEIYCDSSNLTYQRTLKMMSRWLTMLNHEAQADTTPFKEKIAVLLRHVPNIMDDLQSYFFGTPLPDSHPDDFEEVDLDGEAMTDVDEFEEITLPEGREDYNTKLCSCQCHQDQQDEKLRRRIRHCYSCSLKMFDGKPVLKTSRNEYRPINALYPLEEKDKMVKAKKEAAQLALAKARAQRQRKKGKCKKKNVGSLKSKSSKNIPLKKKFKKRTRCKLQSNPADVGNTGSSVTETECKNLNTQDSVITNTQKQDKSDLKSIYSKPSDNQHKASGGKLTETSTNVSDSASTAKASIDTENSSSQLTLSTTNDNGIPTVSHAPEETTVLESKLDSNSSVLKNYNVSRSDEANMEADSNVEVLSSRPTSTSSQKSSTSCSDSNESRSSSSSSVPSVASTGSLDQGLASSDFQNIKHSAIHIQQSQMSMPELNISQTQVLPNLTCSASSTSSAMILSQINSSNSPKVPLSQVSADRQNVLKADTRLNKTVVSSQRTTFTSFGLQPRFATSPMLTSTRIPVLVTIAPQQYLPHKNSVTRNEMYNLRQTNPQTANVTTSVFSPHQIKSTKSEKKLGNHRKETDLSHNVIYSHPVSTQTLTSSSSQSFSFPASVISTDADIVPQGTGCPASTVSDSRIDAIISSNSIMSFASFPSSFMNSDNQAASVSVSSSEKLAPAVEPSDTISSLPSTPVKGQIPAAVYQGHIDNFSLGAFDNTSIGFSQLQHFTQSPSKQVTDSVSKFDLLAVFESSNLGNKDLQSNFASSSSRTLAEPLTFAGTVEKLKANYDKPELTVSDTMQEPQSVSAPISMDNLPATPGGTRPYNDNEMGDDKQAHSIKETEEDLHNLCPQLNPSQILLDDEESNAFVLSVWTEEQDRTIINAVIAEGITRETIKKLHSNIPAKSVEEINSRAKILLQMLEQIGDTESDTDTDTSAY